MKWLKKAMRLLRKSPLFCLLAASGLVFGVLGLWGRQGLYREMAPDLVGTPAGAAVFLGAKEGLYPWDLPGRNADSDLHGKGDEPEAVGEADGQNQATEEEQAGVNVVGSGGQLEQVSEEQAQELVSVSEEAAKQKRREEANGNVSGNGVSGNGIFENGVSDNAVSGNEAAQNAFWEDTNPGAVYAFTQVDDSYFDDALFIGDSRMVGLQDYTELSKHADFYVRTALSVWEIFSEPKAFIKDGESGKKITVEEALQKKQYGKIYLMVGINELGRGTPQSFAGEYEKVINRLQELQPQALIFIQAIMRVGKQKSESDPIFNNANINARNDAISIFANNHNIFYLDGNSSVCGEDGNLREDWTFDQVHLLGVYYDKWREFLLTKGVVREE